ncbi:MAG: pilus assembly protein PilM [Bacillota bacterium]
MLSLKTKLGRYPIGLTWENEELLVAEIQKKQGGPSCKTLKIPIPQVFNIEGQLENKTLLVDSLVKIKMERGWKRRKTVIAFPSKQVSLRFFKLPGMPLKDLRQAVAWEAKQKYGLDKNEYSLDFSILTNTAVGRNDTREIVLAAVLKKSVTDLHEVFMAAGLALEAIDVASFAFSRSLAGNLPSDTFSGNDLVLFLELNIDYTQLIFHLRGHVIFARVITQNYLNRSLTPGKLATEIQITVGYLKTIVQEIVLKEIVVGGLGMDWGGLCSLQDELGIAVKKGVPGFGYLAEPFPEPSFAIALGLALRGFAGDVH